MPGKKNKKRLIVIADDFTGANDTGVQFSKSGLTVNVIINTVHLKKDIELADVVVIDLESRFDTKEIAYRKCFDIGTELYEIGNTIVYKKIDSTFRGNIGAEIDGLMDSLRLKLALLAPAIPASGRTTINGEVYVHNIKLAETEFALDPRTPIQHSRIADIIELQSNRISKEIATALYRDDVPGLPGILLREMSDGSEIFIFDSSEERDLEDISRLVEKMDEHPLLIIGSAGLASYLQKILVKKQEHLGFVFSGSVSEQSRNQVRYAVANGSCSLFFLEAEDLLDDDYYPDALITQVSDEIDIGRKRFVFTSALSREDVDRAFALAHEKGLSPDAVAEKIALAMGKLAALLINRFRPFGVLLTGGDIAIKTVRALHGTGFNIEQEIVPGIPAGKLTGNIINTIVATKSGGFGALDAISKTLDFFNA